MAIAEIDVYSAKGNVQGAMTAPAVQNSAPPSTGTKYGAGQIYVDPVTGVAYINVSVGGANFQQITPGSGSTFSWYNVTGTSESMAINSGYICNNSGTITLTLPSIAPVGSVIEIQGAAGSWIIAQNSGQQIISNKLTSTLTSGTIYSTSRYDSVKLICITANTVFAINNLTGAPKKT